ncbi:MAG: RNA polymerase factor sigma-54 [candidate division NC10 bacterium]|nr:RNA polymerase factor sigma-54 [candidate division NC10 bacterium]MBI2115791.1 RNA polymerase factor sigma-54 [candidate division NC10 bacterium]
MAFDTKLRMLQTQRMIMTPMLQQAISLLQLSRLELVQELVQHLEQNPVLEEALEETADPQLSQEQEAPEAERTEAEKAEEERADRIDDFDWESYLQDASDYRPQIPREELERFDAEIHLTKPHSLMDHLLFQLHLSTSDPELLRLGTLVIGNLDESGYLKEPHEALAASAGVEFPRLEEALRLVQSFEPTGVGARDLRECLLLQLETRPDQHPLAKELISAHLGELEGRQWEKLAGTLGVPVKEIQAAVEYITSLEPKPGRTFGTEEPRYITPDVYIVKVDDRFVVMLNDDGLPRLRVSPYYRAILANKAGNGREVREYLEGRMRSALWLIRSIEQRQRTLFKVADSLVKFQRKFLEEGITALRPLTLKEVAEDIGMHESTVSRVTTNKYIHTPQGLFELKYFFHRGVPATSGDTVSSLKVKDLIHKLLTVEDSGRPLSDQKIVEILRREHGVEIARRTVAKYRGQLRIPASSRRKRY